MAGSTVIYGAFMGETTVVTDTNGDAFGTFTDKRDGQTYRTVKMPDGKIWMAQNLNYKPESGNSWCYNDDESMGEKYGRLYDWKTRETISPAGWHLPSLEEWDALMRAVGGEWRSGDWQKIEEDNDDSYWEGASKKLKAKSGWNWNNENNVSGNGTDDYGFSALPGGSRYFDGFDQVGKIGVWWTATDGWFDYHTGEPYYVVMAYDEDFVVVTDGGMVCSVRCVANGARHSAARSGGGGVWIRIGI